MEGVESKDPENQTLTKTGGEKSHMLGQVLLRSLVVICTAIATWLIFTSKQDALVFGLPFSAKYSYEPAFLFFAYANVAACIFSLGSLCIALFLRHRSTYLILFLHDLVMMALVMAACSAAIAIGQVGTYGNTHSAWLPICDHFGKFCKRVSTAVIFSFLALMMLFALTVLSALRMRAYWSPMSNSSFA